MNTKELILERFGRLSPMLQAAARYVVDHPNEVVIASMRALAARAGAQPATLVRLAQRLDYAGWPQLKAAFAADLGLHSKSYGQRAKTLVGRMQDAALIGEMFEALRGNLDVTESESAEALRCAAKLLRRAKAVHVAGFRASTPIALALVYGYRLFRNEVFLIDGQSGGLEMQLRAIERQHAVVVISFAPYSKEALAVIDAAKSVGSRIVALTDSRASPLALASEKPVLFGIDSPSFFPSVAAGVAAADVLLEILAADAGKDAVRLIERAEKHLFDSGAYLQPPLLKRRPITR
jgi:DNA-binding MurR/RpiR family transcriptional regulator